MKRAQAVQRNKLQWADACTYQKRNSNSLSTPLVYIYERQQHILTSHQRTLQIHLFFFFKPVYQLSLYTRIPKSTLLSCYNSQCTRLRIPGSLTKLALYITNSVYRIISRMNKWKKSAHYKQGVRCSKKKGTYSHQIFPS